MKNTAQKDPVLEYVYAAGTDIYRKIGNLTGGCDIFTLALHEKRYVWKKSVTESPFDSSWPQMTPVSINLLSYTVDDKAEIEKRPIMTIYRVDGYGREGSLTHTLSFDIDRAGNWYPIPSAVNIRMINRYVASKPLADLPMYIDLTQEYILEQPYDFLGDFRDGRLNGWGGCDSDISEGWHESGQDAMIGLTTHEPTLDDIVEKSVDLDNLGDLGDPGESEDLRAYNHYQSNDDPDSDDSDDEDDVASDPDYEPQEDDKPDFESFEYNLEDIFEEQRIDPYDGQWYNESQFIDYYGGTVEWEHQDPKQILLREEYYKFCSIYWELNDHKFKYMFRKYAKTWL